MSQSATPIHVGRNVSLYSPDGVPANCITVWLWNTTPLSARLLLTTHQWDHIRTAGLFDIGNLDLAAEFSFVDSLLVDLEAADSSLPTDARTLKKEFADPNNPLRLTEFWTATGVRDHDSAATSTAADEAATAADAPRVSNVGISMQQSRLSSTPEASTPTDDSATEPSDWENLTDPLAHVAADLTTENRPFEASVDGTSLSLTATVDHATWPVSIEDTTGGSGPDADTEGPCLICSVVPDRLGERRQAALRPALDAYTETLNRGGFVVEAANEGGFDVEFRTPFDPRSEPTSDALTENVTALAEWFDRLAV